MDSGSKLVWLAWAAILIWVLLALQPACCVQASRCEVMLSECERGLEELHGEIRTMCSCGLLRDSEEDAGCALAAAAGGRE